MKKTYTDRSKSTKKWFAIACLGLFLSLFVFESLQGVLIEEIKTEVTESEKSDTEKDSKKGDKETEDKLNSKAGLLHYEIKEKSEYQALLDKKRPDGIRKIVSPPPEV